MQCIKRFYLLLAHSNSFWWSKSRKWSRFHRFNSLSAYIAHLLLLYYKALHTYLHPSIRWLTCFQQIIHWFSLALSLSLHLSSILFIQCLLFLSIVHFVYILSIVATVWINVTNRLRYPRAFDNLFALHFMRQMLHFTYILVYIHDINSYFVIECLLSNTAFRVVRSMCQTIYARFNRTASYNIPQLCKMHQLSPI